MLVLLGIPLFFVAIGFSILGQGGGVLYTPIQVWLGIDFHTAATTSLFLIMTLSFSSSIIFRKAGRIDWPLAMALELVTALGGFVGGLESSRLSGHALSLVFSGVVALAAVFMIRGVERASAVPAGKKRFTVWERRLDSRSYRVDLAVAIPVSFAAGMVSGLVGVGGGILKVPMMVLLFGIPIDIAVASSSFMIGLTAFGGFLGHVSVGHWDWRTSLVLAALVFLGGQIGSRISVVLDQALIKRAFGWFLLGIAVLMLV